MQNKVVVHLRNPFLMDASTYVSTAIMALLGVSKLQNLTLQLIALGLCVTFALSYRFVFRSGYYERNPALYFGAQAVVLVMLFTLKSDGSDAFNFLFYILTVQAAVVLPIRMAVLWTSVYAFIASTVVLLSAGTAGLFAVFFYLVAFVVCVILGYTIQQAELTGERNQKLLEELQVTQRRLQELAVVEERNRLARDLHDSVKQQVFAISMQLSAARTFLSEGDQAYESVKQAERLAQQAGAELTTLIRELRPPSLKSKPLPDAIREYVNEWSLRYKIQAELNIEENISVDPQAEPALFRVLQEALANVARHSRASRVEVALMVEKETVVLTVQDNGVGFDAEKIAKGVGLDSMRERLAALDGELFVSSRTANGTRVIAKVRG